MCARNWPAGKADHAASERPATRSGILCPGGMLCAFRRFPLWPHAGYLCAVLPGRNRRLDLPHARGLNPLVQRSVCLQPLWRPGRRLRAVVDNRACRAGHYRSDLPVCGVGISQKVPWLGAAVLSCHNQPGYPRHIAGPRYWTILSAYGAATELVHLGAWRASDLDHAVWSADHVCGPQPL